MKLHRLIKENMTFPECLNAITDNDVDLNNTLTTTLEVASQILNSEKMGYYGILSMLDVMEIYGQDLNILMSEICCYYEEWLLTVIWSFEVGQNNVQLKKDVPEFAKLEFVKKMISEKKSFPFGEAKKFIEANSPLRYNMRT